MVLIVWKGGTQSSYTKDKVKIRVIHLQEGSMKYVRKEGSMKNIAVIFAGGSGPRIHAKDKPKQFLMVHGKPIIVHTLEHFQNHLDIDGIVVVCIKEWISYMKEMKIRYQLDKIESIVPGGETGQLSIYNGLQETKRLYGIRNVIVLIHDGVRPLIDGELITKNIRAVETYGSAISCGDTKETVALVDDSQGIETIVERKRSKIAKAPQSFFLSDILEMEEKAIQSGMTNMIDSCTLMHYFGKKLHMVGCEAGNIKITTPEDFYMFRAVYDARENEQLAANAGTVSEV